MKFRQRLSMPQHCLSQLKGEKIRGGSNFFRHYPITPAHDKVVFALLLSYFENGT